MTICPLVGLDHLVGYNQQVPRDREAERPRGLEIDDQFEFPVLPDGEFCRVLAPEDAGGYSPIRR
jgi:hypothetical protein